MTFMIEGGAAMWLTLLVFLAGAGLTMLRRASDGWRTSLAAAVGCLACGLSGFATGVYATVDGFRRTESGLDPDILAQGLRESAHNVLWAAVLAALLVVLGLAVARRVHTIPRAA